MARTKKPRPSARDLFSRSSYDRDAPAYTAVDTGPSHTLPPVSARPSTSSTSSGDDEEGADVLREEEEREKLLAGGLFGGKGSIKIGKKVRGHRRKRSAGQVASMMGGKRLGMEAGGEYGIGDESSDGDEDERLGGAWGEKGGVKPRKPTFRKIILFTSLLLSFLVVMIFASLALSQERGAGPAMVFHNGTHAFAKTTLLISLDGLRADFLNRHLTPTLTSFINSGVSPPYMVPSFPSVTFPNHWTIVTGLYPENHGIVSNSFYDPKLKAEFYYTDPARSLQRQWWGGEPIWQTLEKQGGRAAVHMWPGSEADGHGAAVVDRFNSTERLDIKVDRILGLLDLPVQKRPQLVAAYVPDVDVSGHKFGPNTTETDNTIRDVDGMLHSLFLGLEARNLSEIVNVVVVSDHGMASTDRSRLFYFEDLMDTSLIEHVDGWPLYGLRPYPQHNLTEIYVGLKAQETPDGHWSVYLRDVDMPARYHFSRNPRIAPLWIVPETGYVIVTKKEYPPDSTEPYHPRGLHGYDNLHPLMRAMFVARGPAFQHLHGEGKEWLGLDRHSGAVTVNETLTKGAVRAGRVQPFTNVEVYRLLCQSLGIKEAASDATLVELKLVGEDEPEPEVKPGAGDDFEHTSTASTTASSSSDSSSDSSAAQEPTKSIGIQTPEPLPVRPTKISDPNAPVVTGTPQNIGISPPTPPEGEEEGGDDKGGDKTWWELLKSKAERLKGKLEGWWSSVWVDDASADADADLDDTPGPT
ncbi:alkaline-phosphatase-like protein [Tricharina praecox]|uniref:alkaline-phosphatase-like protein n=1 Tax=Tricharina praecox TaxID=43433 RepID=UPI0022210BBD|nr:alkaline-phosphatase-like protein [Tricharina praecox]KAI5857821.1 alkaline-phosphatase-like protein [Tricharina praecox]